MFVSGDANPPSIRPKSSHPRMAHCASAGEAFARSDHRYSRTASACSARSAVRNQVPFSVQNVAINYEQRVLEEAPPRDVAAAT
jgi:hypothetical protein